jgi:F-type H+-transporting ATPase subunit a
LKGEVFNVLKLSKNPALFTLMGLIFAPKFRKDMVEFSIKYMRNALFCILSLVFSITATAQDAAHQDAAQHAAPHEEKLDPAKIILDHIKDAHEFHFFTLENKENPHESFHATIPLPVILYSEQYGLDMFSSSAFGHTGEEVALGKYKMNAEKDIVAADEQVKVYDFSLTKNVVQMIIALVILVLLMTGVAKKYKKGQGVQTAPKGWQNAVEPVVMFVRDEVAKPNLGHKYKKYLPYLLTVFFFILINNLFGLLPGSANVTGNIAFTLVLGVISFFAILFSTNKHYWAHIFWFPGVPTVVRIFIMLPVELLGVFTKPFALIVRLFANMVAGHIIILSFISLIFIFGSMSTVAGWGFSPLSVAFAVFIYLIEIMVAFIQAFIFTNLTAVFIGQALEGDHEHEHHDGDAHHAPTA